MEDIRMFESIPALLHDSISTLCLILQMLQALLFFLIKTFIEYVFSLYLTLSFSTWNVFSLYFTLSFSTWNPISPLSQRSQCLASVLDGIQQVRTGTPLLCTKCTVTKCLLQCLMYWSCSLNVLISKWRVGLQKYCKRFTYHPSEKILN